MTTSEIRDLKPGDPLKSEHKGRKWTCVVTEISEEGYLLTFGDGTSAVFPWRWIVRDFELAKNGNAEFLKKETK
jgi:hypothetical protein